MAWNFLLTDLNGVPHGELVNADERKVGLPHMRVPSLACKIPLHHTWANTVLNTDCLIRAYRTDPNTGVRSLPFHGPVVSAEEVADGTTESISIVAAGPQWRLDKRLIGKTAGGFSQGTVTPVDLGLIAHTVLSTVNGEGFTGIDAGTRSAVTTGGIGPWHLKKASEAIAELHVGVNSFEYVVDPTEPTASGGVGGWPRLGLMRIAPTIGSSKPDAVFEYGTSKANVASYSRAITRDGYMNRAYISVSGWPDAPEVGHGLITRSDTTSITARGLYEDVVPDAEVIDDTLRNGIADFHLLYRKAPKEMLTFAPSLNALPSPITDYMPGDTVRARAVVGGSVRFDSSFRIWSVTFDIDKNGNEQVELELVMP